MIVVKVVAGAVVVAAAGTFAAYTYFKDEVRHPPERDVNLVRRLGPWRYWRMKLRIEAARLKNGVEPEAVNVGLGGCVDAGKSSLANALLAVAPNDPTAAKVGRGSTTAEVRRYRMKAGFLNLYDMPGYGHLKSVKDYFVYYAMCAFDVLIILKQNTGLAQSDVLLAEDALSYGLPVVFVQSKCDNLLRDALEDGSYTTYDAEGRAVVPSAQEAANMLVTELREGHRNNVAQYAAEDFKLDGSKILFFANHGKAIPFFCVSSRVLYEHACREQSGKYDYSFEEAEFLKKLVALKKEARFWTDRGAGRRY